MRKKLAFFVAAPITFDAFLSGHASSLKDEYDVTVVSNFKLDQTKFVERNVRCLHIPIERKISIISDIQALIQTYFLFHREKFDIVHSVTPKAGLIGSIAGVLSRTEHRVHTFTGQVWAGRSGISRAFLKLFDKITMTFSTKILADSRSQADFLILEGFKKDIIVLADGSIAGIDAKKFSPNAPCRKSFRKAYNVSKNDCVFMFLGRLNRDKGVLDLVDGFIQAQLDQSFKLFIVGPDEEDIAAQIQSLPQAESGQILVTGSTDVPENMLAGADVLCLPSYREGFGNSVLEAAAMGLPAIVSRIYGLTDAVVESTTGIMHRPGSTSEIASCIKLMAHDSTLRKYMGGNARARVLELYSPDRITNELRSLYTEMLKDSHE